MLIKPLAAALALTLTASPALAERWHDNGWHHGGRWNGGGYWRHGGWDDYRYRRGGSSLVISIGGYYPAYGYYPDYYGYYPDYYSYGYPSYGYYGYYERP